MGLVVIPAGNGDIRQTGPRVCDQAACPLEAENPCVSFRCDADSISKAFAEVTAAISGNLRKLFYRNCSMCLRESLPRPRDFRLGVSGFQCGDQQVVENPESLLPSPRTAHLFHEI